MRTMIGLAVVVAIGLIWSAAATSKLVPVNSAEMQVGQQQVDSAVTVGTAITRYSPAGWSSGTATS